MKVMAVAFLLLPSCVAKAQFDLSSLSNLGDVVTNLTSVFNPDQQASTKSIVGTWEYSEPAILFTSDNFLAQAGAKIASNKIEQNIQKHLNKYGIKKGALKFTFRSDGTYTEVLGKKTLAKLFFGHFKAENYYRGLCFYCTLSRNVKRKSCLSHSRTSCHDDKIRRLQAGGLFIKSFKTCRKAYNISFIFLLLYIRKN